MHRIIRAEFAPTPTDASVDYGGKRSIAQEFNKGNCDSGVKKFYFKENCKCGL